MKTVHLGHHMLAATTSLAALAAAGTAVAQDNISTGVDQGRSLEEIVVTARRTAESALSVPVAVSALSAQTLERSHVSDMSQIAQLTQQLVIVPALNGGASMSIRGVGSTFQDAGLDQSVGIVIDNVSISRGRVSYSAQFDLQQVEVLKGPQALFFGKNSPAGVLSIRSANPTHNWSGMVRAGYEFEAEEKFTEGFISGPITDNLFFRVAAKYSDLNGWIKNTTVAGPNLAYPAFPIQGPSSGDTPSSRNFATRVTLQWEPTDDFSANLKYFFNRINGSGDEGNIENFCVGPAAAVGHLSTLSFQTGQYVYDPTTDCKFDRRRQGGQVPEAWQTNFPEALKHDGKTWHRVTVHLASLDLEKQVGDLALTSVTGFYVVKQSNFGQYSGTSFGNVGSFSTGEDTTAWTQEFRAASSYDGPLNFTAGAFFERVDRDQPGRGSVGYAGPDPTNGNSTYSLDQLWTAKSRTGSGFAQMRWAMVDNVELSGGVRYSHETKRAQGQNFYLNALGRAIGLAPVGQVVRQSLSFSNWSPEVTLSYKPSQDFLAYVAYKTGYKSGGISTPSTISRLHANDPTLLQFQPERSKGFEAGIKGELFGRSLRFALTAYRYNFTDLQLTTYNPNPPSFFIKNAGAARTSGVEAEVTWRATRELTLDLSGAYNRALYTDFKGAQCHILIRNTPACPNGFYDRTGQPLPRAPRWSFKAGANYETEISTNLKFGLNGDANYQSSFQASETGLPEAVISPKWRFNAGARIGAADDKWELALIGRNLSDQYFPMIIGEHTFGNPAVPGEVTGFSLRPREIVVQGTFRF